SLHDALPISSVILNGSGSFDHNAGGTIVSYRWVQLTGIPVTFVGGVSGSDSPYPKFTAPIIPFNTNTLLTFGLTVTDNFGLSSTNPSTVSVLVSTQQQLPQQQLPQQQLPQQQLPQQQLPQQQLPQQQLQQQQLPQQQLQQQ